MIVLGIIEAEAARRAALWQYLSAQPEFACVLCTDSHAAFLDGLAQVATVPHLVLADMRRPGCADLTGLASLRQRLPQVEIVLLSGQLQTECVLDALREGVVGYLEDDTPLPLLKQSLLQVAAGGGVISPRVARLVTRYFRPPTVRTPLLTAREQQVLRGLTAGLRYQAIADQLHLSIDTVRSHVRQVYRKQGVHSRPGLLAQLLKLTQAGG
jgi:DNA-binding NarL/FixJ family response regulator